MLELKEVSKIYKVADFEQKALDNVSIKFRKNEFVSILGQSGSGKSTLLNIIGGLDHYTSGDLIINGVSTKQYKASDWDTYRNHRIGFVFQNYNLIMHQSILSNVELALTLSGVTKSERKKRAQKALESVGLEKHINKNPTQLSGGQMQRVAIARALVNDPDIILADEPTGALDSETSIQIMELLKKVAKEKLVIMVTHNPELAKTYSTRIVNLKDGRILDDSQAFDGNEEKSQTDNKKKSSMGLFTALSLSKNNLVTKKGRTIITAIAGSIGIFGIALILGLSNGVSKYADKMQKESFGSQPISIESETISESSSIDASSLNKPKTEHNKQILAVDDVSNNFEITEKKDKKENDLKKFKEHIEKNKTEVDKLTSDVEYIYDINLNIYDKDKDDNILKINPITNTSATATGLDALIGSLTLLKDSFGKIINESNYELLSGSMPKNYNELVLITNENEEIQLSTLYSLNIEDKNEVPEMMKKSSNGEKINLGDKVFDYNSLIGKTYKLIAGSDYYQKVGNVWLSRENDNQYIKQLYNDKSIELKIVGVAKVKDKNIPSSYLGYTNELNKYIIENANKTDIAKEQMANQNINVFTGTPFDEMTSSLKQNLKILGAGNLEEPNIINLYPKNIEAKEEIKKFINNYNSENSEEDKIIYVDQMESLTKTITNVVKMISSVLVALVSISLIVSCLMIGIITYVSVLERTKEIGILKAIGASKKDIVRVFRAETIIEGLASGALGVGMAFLISGGVNAIVNILAKIENIMVISPVTAGILILVSILLTMFAGSGPAKVASKKDPVESLKAE